MGSDYGLNMCRTVVLPHILLWLKLHLYFNTSKKQKTPTSSFPSTWQGQDKGKTETAACYEDRGIFLPTPWHALLSFFFFFPSYLHVESQRSEITFLLSACRRLVQMMAQFLSAAVTCVVAMNSGGHERQQEQPFTLSPRPTSERIVSLLLSSRQH